MHKMGRKVSKVEIEYAQLFRWQLFQCYKHKSPGFSDCGQGVRVLAFYYDDPCSNPTEVYSFSVKFVLE